MMQLENDPVLWDISVMKLTADNQGKLGNAEIFRPEADFEATVQSDGSIRLVELAQAPGSNR